MQHLLDRLLRIRTVSRLLRTPSNHTSKNTDFTMSLGNLSQCLTSLTVKMLLFLMFKWIFFYFSWCTLLLVLSPGTTKSLSPFSLLPLSSGTYIEWQDLPGPSLLQAEQSLLSQPLFRSHMGLPQILLSIPGNWMYLWKHRFCPRGLPQGDAAS